MSTPSTPLAIIGMACHLPGAPSPAKLWEQSLSRQQAIADCPTEWARYAGLAHPLRAGRVGEIPFDWKAFRMPPHSANEMHGAERLTVQVVASSLLDAGYQPGAGPDRLGIYLAATGLGVETTRNTMLTLRSAELTEAVEAELATRGLGGRFDRFISQAAKELGPQISVDTVSTTASIVAGRVSSLFNTTGGHFAIDAGPASSLTALKIAAQALTLEHCDVAAVGALAPMLSPSTFAVLHARGWLAHGDFAPLRELAAGLVPGEGAGALLLCRLEDAEREGRRIYGVLRSVGQASQPNVTGVSRLSVIVDRAAREALDQAVIDADVVEHVETDACGVLPWEDEELFGIRSAYTSRRAGAVSVGAGAAQVGFQQCASGMVSLLRATLAVSHKTRPPTAGHSAFRKGTLGELTALSEPAPLSPEALVGVSNTAAGVTALHALIGPVPQHGRARRRMPAAKRDSKIAVVGMGAIAPGAKDAPTLWRNILAKVDAIADLPDSRFDAEKLIRPLLADGATLPKLAGVVEMPPLDPKRFRLPPAMVARFDRSIVLSLIAGAEALESAGYQEGLWDRRRVKVVFGQLPLRERELEIERRFTLARFLDGARQVLQGGGLAQTQIDEIEAAVRARYTAGLVPVNEEAFSYYSGLACAARLAACYDFAGGPLSVDAACASSMAAVHTGALALLSGEADVVVAGGVAYNLVPEYFVALSALNVICARGSFPFDDRADGFVPGEGAGAVVLKRLEAAEAAHDKVLAVISGIGASSDGRGASVFAPNPAGPAKAVQRAMDAAQVDPTWVDYLEAHGSGTRRSDVSEATAYGQVFEVRGRDNPVALGAVKSQIGHLSSAGGMMGLIKTVYALTEQTLPPMNGGEYPNPEIPFEQLPLALSLEARPWRLPVHGRRRAMVNSLGMGGTNYSLLLEEHDNIHLRDRRVDPRPATRPAPMPARGLFASRWAIDMVPLSLPETPRYPLDGKRFLVLVERPDVSAALVQVLTAKGAQVRPLSMTGMRSASDVERRVRSAIEAMGGADGVIDACEFQSREYFLAQGHERFWASAQETSARWLGTARVMYQHFTTAGRAASYMALTCMGGDFGFLGEGGNVLGGSIAGFLKGLKQEIPSLVTKVVDFPVLVDAREAVENAIRELEDGSDRVEVGYFGGRRFGVGLKLANFPEGDQVRREMDPSWVLLCSGGGRGAVFEVAKALARMGPRVIVTGRTPMPDGGEPHLLLDDAAFEVFRREEMLRLKREDPSMTPVKFAQLFDEKVRSRELYRNLADVLPLGLPIQYEVCDVRDAEQVRALVDRTRQMHGRIDGVIHGAMLEASKSLPDKTDSGVEATLAVKVLGLINLLEATQHDDLKLVMCFGSGAGRFGNRGQSDYCAANDLMSKCTMAYASRARPSARCVTIDWTAWHSVGAATRTKDLVEATGVSFISPAEGTFWFINELMLGGSEREVAIFEERLFREWPFLGSSAEGPSHRRLFDDRGIALVRSDRPLIERLVEQSPSQTVAARTFDLTRDRFLLQHQLYGVPIVPGTFGFELMAEGASLVRPDLTVLRGEQLEIGVPLKLFRGQPVPVEIQARVLREVGDQVEVEVETRSTLKLGQSDRLQTRVHHRGRWWLGPAPTWPQGSGALPQALPGARARSIFHLAKDPVYLGPLFCRAEWVYVGPASVEGIIRAPRQREIFSDISRPSFAFDPLLMDAAFQVAANWDGHHLKVVSVPMGVERLERGRLRRLDEGAHVRATPVGTSGLDTFYDIEVRGDDGAMLLQVRRLVLRRLSANRDDSQ